MVARPRPVALAHRGFSLDGHENTLRAFRAAQELGYRWVETDVNTTVDGVVLAFHDPSLDRVTDTSGEVCDLPWEQLEGVRIGQDEPLAVFEHLLRDLPDVHFNIDVKDEASVTALPRVLAGADAVHRVRVTSFSEARRRRTLAAIARLTGQRPRTSAGTVGSAGLVALSKLARVSDALSPRIAEAAWRALTRLWSRRVAPFDTVQLPVRYVARGPGGRGFPVAVVTPAFVALAHRLGIAVHVWTVNEPEEMRRLLDLGVDGVITDRADLLAEVLTERGEWPATGM